MANANSKQVGGAHYQSGFQHWDLVAMYGLGYFEGQISKYVSRHAKKNGLQDVEKAIHYTDKLLELFTEKKYLPTHVTQMPGRSGVDGLNPAQQFGRINKLTADDTMVINKLCTWTTWEDIMRVRTVLNAIAATYTPVVQERRREGKVHQVDHPGAAWRTNPADMLSHTTIKIDPTEPGSGYVDQDRTPDGYIQRAR